MIQLLPGLSIQFADDGTWLYFEGMEHKGAICLENTLVDHPVIGGAVREFLKTKRENIGLWR